MKDKTIWKLSRTNGEVIAAHGINITLQWIPGHTKTYRETKELIPLLNKVQDVVHKKTTPLPLSKRQSNNTKQKIGGTNGQTVQQAGPYLLT